MTANPLSTIPPIGTVTGQAAPAAAGRFKPIDPIKLLRSHMRLLVVTAVLGAVCGGGIWFILDKDMPRYKSQMRALVVPPQAAFSTETDALGGSKSNDATESRKLAEIDRLKSEDMARDVLAVPRVQATNWYQQFGDNPELAVRAFRDDLFSALPGRGALLTLEAETPVEAEASLILSEIWRVYDITLRRVNEDNTLGLRRVFQQEFERAEADVKLYEERKQRFLARHDIESIQANQTSVYDDLNILTNQHREKESEIRYTESALTSLEEKLKDGPGKPSIDQYRQLEGRIEILQVDERLRSIARQAQIQREQGLGENSQVMRNLDASRRSEERVREDTIQRLFEKNQLAYLERLRDGLEKLKSDRKDLADLRDAAQTKYNDLQALLGEFKRFDEMQAQAIARRNRTTASLDDLTLIQQRPDFIRVQLHTRPDSPRQSFPNAFTTIAGTTGLFVVLMTGLVVMRELLDQRIRSPADIKLLQEATLLGMIPDPAEDPSGIATPQRVVAMRPHSLLTESFRQVRTAVLSKMDRRGYKTVVLVSAQGEAGTTTVAENLAASMAINGRRVLLVDANFRRPRLDEIMQVPNDRGLIDLLGDSDLQTDDVIHETESARLWIMPTGTGEATPEMLEGAVFRSLLGELESRFDLVVIDAPPALLASEARLMAKYVDAIALVVRAAADKRGMIDRMIAQLDGHRADILGVVLNGVKTSAGGYYRKSYQDFYRYASGPRSNSIDRGDSIDRSGSIDRDRNLVDALDASSDSQGDVSNGHHPGSNGSTRLIADDVLTDGPESDVQTKP